MQVFINLARVLGTTSIMSATDEALSKGPNGGRLLHTISADAHWRLRDWDAAIEQAKRVLATKPSDFHALSIIVNSYGQGERYELAYPFAKQLMGAVPSSWIFVKIAYVLVGGWISFLRPSKRKMFYQVLARCDAEARFDEQSLAWARDLVSGYEMPKGDSRVLH